MTSLLVQAFIYLCAAVIMVPLAKRFGLGSVLGYLIAGVIIGPVTVAANNRGDLWHCASAGSKLDSFLGYWFDLFFVFYRDCFANL